MSKLLTLDEIFADMDNILEEAVGSTIFKRLVERWYKPSGMMEYYDPVTHNWYNQFGTKLENITDERDV